MATKPDPHITRNAIASMLAAGASLAHVAKTQHVSKTLVHEISKDAQAVIPWKQQTAEHAEHVASKVLSSWESDLDSGKVKPAEKPIAFGILIDKALLLRQEAVALTGPTEPTVSDMLQELRGLAGPQVQVNIQVNHVQQGQHEQQDSAVLDVTAEAAGPGEGVGPCGETGNE